MNIVEKALYYHKEKNPGAIAYYVEQMRASELLEFNRLIKETK